MLAIGAYFSPRSKKKKKGALSDYQHNKTGEWIILP